MTSNELTEYAKEVAAYERRFRKSEAKRIGLECEVAARGYEVEAMYNSLLEQERVHIETIHLLQQIVNHIPMPIFWKDSSRIVRGCNAACEKALGISKEEIIGKTVFDIFDTEYAAIYDEADGITLSKGKHTYVSEFKKLSGEIVKAIFHMACYYNCDNEMVGLIVFAHTPCDGRLCP